jgi:hypothetical protein
VDDETRRTRHLAAHARRAQDHPVWELYGRRLVWWAALLALVLLLGSFIVSQIGPASRSLVSAVRGDWRVTVLILVSLVVSGLAWRRLRSPYRMPRRYR